MSLAFLDSVHANPWGEQFIDLPELNSAASDEIARMIEAIRTQARERPSELRSSSLAVVGPAGAGKTHLFARLRRKLGPRAVFVHVRPLVATELTPRFVLHEIVSQLGHSSADHRQIDTLVGSLLAHLAGIKVVYPKLALEDLRHLSASDRLARTEATLEAILGRWPLADESVLTRLLGCPLESASTQRAMLAWLSGRECDDLQLARIGAHGSLGEELVIPALRTIASVAALGAPLVLVFDQLENLFDAGTSPRMAAYARVASELVDTVPGLAVVQMAIDTEWKTQIFPALNLAQRSRLAQHAVTLGLPSRAQREALLRRWHEELDEPRPAFPEPFGDANVGRWCADVGVTPRMLMIECKAALEMRALAGTDGALTGAGPSAITGAASDEPEALDGALRRAWEEHLTQARADLDEAAEQKRCADGGRVTDGLVLAIAHVAALQLEAVTAAAPAQLRLRRPREIVNVALLHQANPRSVASILGKLAVLAKKEAVLVLRERAHELKPTWQESLGKQRELLKAGAAWCALERDDVVRLLGLAGLLQAARSGDVTGPRGETIPDRDVRDWASRSLSIDAWNVTQALVGSKAADPDDEAKEPLAKRAAPRVGGALLSLARLRVASVDRLVREVRRVEPSADLASVLSELERDPARVRWFGQAIVAYTEAP